MHVRNLLSPIIAVSLLAVTVVACQSGQQQEETTAQQQEMEEATINRAVAVIHPTEGNEVTGRVLFSKAKNGIRVQAELEGLREGAHGFHIHEYGDCTADDGTSAGGHYNPKNVPHAGPKAQVRHVGDLGNITANAQGQATYNRVDEHLAFSGESNIVGRGVVVHQGKDDLESQPSGAAGPRVACGVIGVANPETGTPEEENQN